MRGDQLLNEVSRQWLLIQLLFIKKSSYFQLLFNLSCFYFHYPLICGKPLFYPLISFNIYCFMVRIVFQTRKKLQRFKLISNWSLLSMLIGSSQSIICAILFHIASSCQLEGELDCRLVDINARVFTVSFNNFLYNNICFCIFLQGFFCQLHVLTLCTMKDNVINTVVILSFNLRRDVGKL